jgi:hypothetical protein
MGNDSAVNNAAWVVNYNFAEDRTADYRTFQQKQQNITHGLRFVYDPALAMPYYRPTSINTYTATDPITGDPLRSQLALRFIKRPDILDAGNNIIFKGVIQTLPATPRLPVCPGLLYFGVSDRPVAP